MVDARAQFVRGLPDRWRRAWLLFTGLALAAAMGLALPSEVAAKTILSSGSVSPGAGVSGTTFSFRVTSKGTVPTSVQAVITGPVPKFSIALRAPAGGVNGVWSASRQFKTVGTYTVTFTASGTSVPGGTFRVTPGPTPTPSPTPRPTPIPTAPPLPPPTATARTTAAVSASPRATATPSGSPSPTAAATPVVIGGLVAPTPTSRAAAASGSRPGDDSGSLLLAIGLGLVVIVGVGGIALLAGRRRAEEQPVMAAASVGGGMPMAAAGTAGVTESVAGGPPAAPTPPRTPPPPPQPRVTRDAAAFAARVNTREEEEGRGDPGAGGTPRVRRAWEAKPGIEDAPIGTVDEVLIDGIPRSWERGEEDRRGRRRPAERDDDFEED